VTPCNPYTLLSAAALDGCPLQTMSHNIHITPLASSESYVTHYASLSNICLVWQVCSSANADRYSHCHSCILGASRAREPGRAVTVLDTQPVVWPHQTPTDTS
jgi:hypothetical protein